MTTDHLVTDATDGPRHVDGVVYGDRGARRAPLDPLHRRRRRLQTPPPARAARAPSRVRGGGEHGGTKIGRMHYLVLLCCALTTAIGEGLGYTAVVYLHLGGQSSSGGAHATSYWRSSPCNDLYLHDQQGARATLSTLRTAVNQFLVPEIVPGAEYYRFWVAWAHRSRSGGHEHRMRLDRAASRTSASGGALVLPAVFGLPSEKPLYGLRAFVFIHPRQQRV